MALVAQGVHRIQRCLGSVYRAPRDCVQKCPHSSYILLPYWQRLPWEFSMPIPALAREKRVCSASARLAGVPFCMTLTLCSCHFGISGLEQTNSFSFNWRCCESILVVALHSQKAKAGRRMAPESSELKINFTVIPMLVALGLLCGCFSGGTISKASRGIKRMVFCLTEGP